MLVSFSFTLLDLSVVVLFSRSFRAKVFSQAIRKPRAPLFLLAGEPQKVTLK
jgi:hypothetical protein